MIGLFSKSARKFASQNQQVADGYFASPREYGPLKMLDMLQESVFWQYSLMEKAAKFSGFLTGAFILMFFVILFFISFASIARGLEWTSDIFIAVVLALMTSGFLMLTIDYKHIGMKIKVIDDELDSLRKDMNLDLLKIFVKLDEYNCLLVSAPGIPDFIYNKYHEELDNDWGERKKAYE